MASIEALERVKLLEDEKRSRARQWRDGGAAFRAEMNQKDADALAEVRRAAEQYEFVISMLSPQVAAEIALEMQRRVSIQEQAK